MMLTLNNWGCLRMQLLLFSNRILMTYRNYEILKYFSSIDDANLFCTLRLLFLTNLLARLIISIKATEGHGHQRGYRCPLSGQSLIICLSKFSCFSVLNSEE